MIGQGGPTASPIAAVEQAGRAVRWVCRLALAVCLGFWLCDSPLADETMRVRIAWGGGAERLWQGVIGVDQGTVSEPVPLGIEADEPGSMWLNSNPLEIRPEGDERGKPLPVRLSGDHLVLRQRSPRTYDGVDLLITAPLSAALVVQLTALDSPTPSSWLSIPLKDLVGNTYSAGLDERGNRILVRRAPGDELRVTVAGRSLIFPPGGVLKCQVQPHLLAVDSGSKLRIKAQLNAGRTSNSLWSAEYTITAGEPTSLPIEVRLDQPEGVYDLVITATYAGGLRWPPSVTPGLGHRQVVAERKVQIVVISPDPPTGPATGGQWSRVVEIDPAAPKWWERFSKLPQLPRLPRLGKGPLSNGNLQSLQHPLGQLAQLRSPANSRDTAWEAYPLPINRPGLPHILEIDYPSDVPQTMGISIIEPNAAGAVMPIGLDSGVEVAEEITADKSHPRWQRHRLVFWPRTKAPIVLVTNRREKGSAVYGKIRVMGGLESLPRAFPARAPRPERLLACLLYTSPSPRDS